MTRAKPIDEATAQSLRDSLRYDPETGEIWWRFAGHGKDLSKPAGTLNDQGYLTLSFKGRTYRLHRLSYLLMGLPVPDCIDHSNGVRSDNRWENLRPATKLQNNINTSLLCRNTSGFKGVYKQGEGNKWVSQIRFNGQKYHLGVFDSPEEAHEAYKKAADKYHGEFKNYG